MRIFSNLAMPLLVFAFTNLAMAEYCPYKLVTYKSEAGEVSYGLLANLGEEQPTNLIDVSAAVKAAGSDLISSQTNAALSEIQCQAQANPQAFAARAIKIKPEQVLPAIPQSKNVVAMGLNAKSHAAELGMNGSDGFIFAKNIGFTGAYDPIIRPAYSLLDYENELGVVIRKPITKDTKITPENVREYIAGFVLTNDVSNRAPILLDKGDGSFTAAKTYPSFLPVGPYFVPIENFKLREGKLLPSLKMKTLVSKRDNPAQMDLRQNGSTDEDDFFNGLAGALDMAFGRCKECDKTDVGADVKPQKLLKDGQFEAGDLLLMGTIAGVALQVNFEVGKHVIIDGIRNKKADTMAIFWPPYEKYFQSGATKFCADRDYGGPPVYNCWENWMRAKTWIVANEYCKDDLYLLPGQEIEMSIEGLGKQRSLVVSNPQDPVTQAEAELRGDPNFMKYLCTTHGRTYNLYKALGQISLTAGTIWAVKKFVWTCESAPCKIARFATISAAVVGSLYTSVNRTLSSAAAPYGASLSSSEYDEVVKLLGYEKANLIVFDLQNGYDVKTVIEQNITDPVLRAEVLKALQ